MEDTERTFDVSENFKSLSRNALIGLVTAVRKTAVETLAQVPGETGVRVAQELIDIYLNMKPEFEIAVKLMQDEQGLEARKQAKEQQTGLWLPTPGAPAN